MKPSKHNAPIVGLAGHRLPSPKTNRPPNGDLPRNLKAEKPRSSRQMIIFTLTVLLALTIVPFLLLRPQAHVYRLLNWSGATVKRDTILENVSSSGTIVPRDTQQVKARVTGTLQTVSVNENDDVRRGQILARIGAPELERVLENAINTLNLSREKLHRDQINGRQQIRAAQTTLLTAQSKLTSLKTDLKNLSVLFALGAEPKADLEAAQRRFGAAQIEVQDAQDQLASSDELLKLDLKADLRAVEVAKASISQAQYDLERTAVVSPMAGRVVALTALSGQDVKGGDPLFTVTGLQHMNIEALVDESVANRVKTGQPVRISIDGADFQGQVSSVASQIVKTDLRSSVKIAVRLDSRPKLLLPNTSVGLEITVGRRIDVPTLPRGAYLSTGGEVLVYVLNKNKTEAKRHQVIFGISNANQIEIRSGLEVGEEIVTSSYEVFKDQPVIEVSSSGEIK